MMRLLFLLAPLCTQDPPPALGGMDPVTLCRNAPEEGRDALVVLHHGYCYWFASEASRAAFQVDPDRFEIQLGGACGRMGPLSGKGDPDRYLVYDGRIYIFSSDGCREGFLRDPERHLRADDPRPEADEEGARRGRELLAKAVLAHGGERAFAAMETLELVRERRHSSGGVDYRVVTRERWRYPDQYHSSQSWNGEGFGLELVGGDADRVLGDGSREPLHPVALRSLRWRMAASPWYLLRCADQPGVFVRFRGTGPVRGQTAVTVEVWRDGVSHLLHLNPATHRVLGLSWRGRLGGGEVGSIHVDYSDWREVGGLQLPFHARTERDGSAVEGWSGPYREVLVNAAVSRDG